MLAGVRYRVDSGWAWVVCVASFFVQCVVFGTIQSFGTLFISLLNDFKSGESATAWIGSLGYGFLFVIGPVTTVLCEHFGCRVMTCAGSVLTTVSLLVTSFAPSIATMYFTFGVVWGTGGSFLFFSGLLVLRFYFNRNLSLANGITMTGAGFGTLVFNVMLQELDEKYGWRGGMRFLSIFSALTFLCGCAFIPPPVDYLAVERQSLWFRLKRLIDPRPWRDRAFTMWVFALSFILFAYFFPYTYLVRMALTLGIPVSQGALLLGYLSISAIFGKLLSGRLADLPRVRRLYIFIFSALVLSLSSMCVTAAKSYHGLLAYTLVAGFFDGCFVVTVPLITQDIVGKELMAKAIGNLYGVVAFPLTLGPPVLGELYKTTNSFTIAFFVSSSFVLVGVSIIYIVQRIRPDLVRKRDSTRHEVYDSSLVPSPSIHSASVVDTLSGMFVTEPGLSASHLDPMEVGSYQRFDRLSLRREESRANFLESVHGRMANPTEIEAVYRQAVDNLSNISGVPVDHRNASDTSGNFNVNVPTQSRSASMLSSSIQSLSEMPTVNFDSSPGLQIPSGGTMDLTKASESSATLVDSNIEASPHRVDEVGISISGDGTILQEGEQQEKVSVTSDMYPNPSSPIFDILTALEANGIEQADTEFSDFITKPQLSQVAAENKIPPEPIIVDKRDIELEVELVALHPPPDIHRKRRADPLDTVSNDQSDIASILGSDGPGADATLKTERTDPYAEAIQESDQSPRTALIEAIALEIEESVENECINDLLELVRIPPPPCVPRTGQLVALESEPNKDEENISVSEVKPDAEQDNQYDKEEAVNDNSSCSAVSTSHRKERLHLAIIDQLNLLSERLEAVAARQSQEEDDHRDDDQPDQRPPFSPALQSLPLTPLYSANHSVPLTPACAWSSYLNTPAPTPRQTPPSAFLTTAPTPIYTPYTPAPGVSGICTPSDVSMANPSHSNIYETGQANTDDSNKWYDRTDVCSLSPSQEALSRQRSRCSSFSEAGQEFAVNEWGVRDPHGSTEPFSSKPSSGTNSSVSNSARSIGDLKSVSEPIDILDFTINESHNGHMNSPENYSPSQQVDASADMCLPQKPCLNYEITDVYRQNPLQQSHLNSNLTEVQTNQINDSCKEETSHITQQLAKEVPHEELFNTEMSLVVHTCLQSLNTTDAEENELEMVGPTVENIEAISNTYQLGSTSILLSEVDSNASTYSEPQQKIEYRADSRDIQVQQTRFDPSPLGLELNSFLESDQTELTEFSQCNPFQQPYERLPDESLNPFQIPGGLDSHDEQSRSYQSEGLTIGKEQYIAEQMEAFSSENRPLTQLSPKFYSTPHATDSHFEPYCAENGLDQQVVPQRNNFMEDSDTGIMEPMITISENPKLEANQEVGNSRSQWTVFSQSEESLIFAMETENESSSDSDSKLENSSTSASSDPKSDNCVADKESLFPPLQNFCEVADMITEMNGQGTPVTIPPPPKQAHRKRVDKSVSVTAEISLPCETGSKESESRPKSVGDKQNVDKTGLAPASMIENDHQGTPKLTESIETHHVPSDEDLSATGNSFSEIESDFISESKLGELPNKQSDISICGIVCQKVESINDVDELFASEKADDLILDGEMVKTSINDDFAPLLVQNNEPIQYVNLGDFPADCLVLHKRPSSTSSTDDSSSTSTDSSLSENEMPYSKLHEDTPAEG